MRTSDDIAELASALSLAQGEMAHASKDRTNPAFKSKYADLASVVDACREPLSKNGIAVVQPPSIEFVGEDVMVKVETRFVHKTGQWMSTELSAWVADAKAQSIGSAITYLRRYGLSAMAGVAPDDDDGNAAVGRQDPARPPVAPARLQSVPTSPPAPSAAAPAKPDPTPQSGRAMIAKSFPHALAEADAIIGRNMPDAAKVAELRKVYSREQAKASAPPPADSPARAEARRLVARFAMKDALGRESLDCELRDFSSGSGRVEDIAEGDLPTFVSVVTAIINGTAPQAAS